MKKKNVFTIFISTFVFGIITGVLWHKSDFAPFGWIAQTARNAFSPSPLDHKRFPARLNFDHLGWTMEERIQSDAYEDYDWAKDFIEEINKKPSPGLTYEPFSLWKHNPYTNKYITYQSNGYRKVTAPPRQHKKNDYRIFIFGGSAIAGDGILRDQDLIPSQLSQILNESNKDTYFEVNNYAQSGFNQGNEIVLLIRLLSAGDIPDYVIFYDGANDIVHRVGLGVPHMGFRRFKQVISADAPPDIKGHISEDEVVINQRITDLVELYEGNLNILKALSKHYGFKFLLLLQPHLFSKKALSEEEKKLRLRIFNYAPSLPKIFIKGYGSLTSTLKKNGEFVDMSNAYGENDQSCYIDFVHVNPEGNRIVSEAIVRTMEDRWQLN